MAQVIDHRLAHGASIQGFGPEAKQAMTRAALDPVPEELQVGLYLVSVHGNKLFSF